MSSKSQPNWAARSTTSLESSRPIGDSEFDWSGVIVLPPNVRFALGIYNPSFAATFGLGYARYSAPAGFTGNLQLLTTRELHPDVDNDAGVHGLILHGLQNLAGH